MRKSWARLSAWLLVVVLASPAAAADMGIVTGSTQGTYYQFGLNLQALLKHTGTNLNVYPSKGSIENVYAVYERPGVQLGIVQSDVLAFVSKVQTDRTLKQIAKKVKMVFPLYNEEVHVLARGDLQTFDDLSDRRVATGREGSGTYLTARLLFNISEVNPREMVPIDTEEALAELKRGRVDAMFYVAGYPVKLFSEGVVEADGLKLLTITSKSITEFYPSSEIPANTYRWQPKAVPTVAVKSVLISFDYRKRDCDTVGQAAKTLAGELGWLVKNGHAKWKTVDLEFPLKGWEQYDCVRKYLGKAVAPARTGSRGANLNPVMEAIKEALGEQ